MKNAIGLAFFVSLPLILGSTAGLAQANEAPVSLVDPFMGTQGDRGQLSPAAAAPFGMIQLAPDTTPANHIGYDRAALSLRGFSQTRAQGVGCDGGGGDLLTSVGYANEPGPWPIDKASERAGAGWYTVRYGKNPITAELAASQSVSVSRFQFSRAGSVRLRLDPRHSYARHVDHRWLSTQSEDIRVAVQNATVCDKGVYHLFFAGKLTLDGRAVQASSTVDTAGVLEFSVDVKSGSTLELQLAPSTVDTESATATLGSSGLSNSVDAIKSNTSDAWNALLSRIQFEGNQEDRALFYTALFRAMQMPSRVDDPLGWYRGADGERYRAPPRRHRYAGWSLWDNYRTQMPLVALVAPEIARDVGDSLTELFIQGKAQWAGPTEPFLSVRTEHAGIAILDLYRKRIGLADPRGALAAMARETSQLPNDTPDQKLELAYDQWAVAELAKEVGDQVLADEFSRRSLAYRPIWLETFRNLGDDADTVKARGLYQGTLWQYRWAPVFDIGWVMSDALGQGRFKRELREFFGRSLFNMTNEPDIHTPFLFALTDEPQRMDEKVAALRCDPMDHWYDNKQKLSIAFHQKSFSLAPGFAEGMDDDGGAMSSWYVWASIGLFPLVPGEPWYVITLPASRHIVMDVGDGRQFSIITKGPKNGARIKRISLNGKRLHGRKLQHAAVASGGILLIETKE